MGREEVEEREDVQPQRLDGDERGRAHDSSEALPVEIFCYAMVVTNREWLTYFDRYPSPT